MEREKRGSDALYLCMAWHAHYTTPPMSLEATTSDW